MAAPSPTIAVIDQTLAAKVTAPCEHLPQSTAKFTLSFDVAAPGTDEKHDGTVLPYWSDDCKNRRDQEQKLQTRFHKGAGGDDARVQEGCILVFQSHRIVALNRKTAPPARRQLDPPVLALYNGWDDDGKEWALAESVAKWGIPIFYNPEGGKAPRTFGYPVLFARTDSVDVHGITPVRPDDVKGCIYTNAVFTLTVPRSGAPDLQSPLQPLAEPKSLLQPQSPSRPRRSPRPRVSKTPSTIEDLLHQTSSDVSRANTQHAIEALRGSRGSLEPIHYVKLLELMLLDRNLEIEEGGRSVRRALLSTAPAERYAAFRSQLDDIEAELRGRLDYPGIAC